MGRNRCDALATVERPAAIEELAVHRGDGADAQGVALAAPDGYALVERGTFGGLQFGGADGAAADAVVAGEGGDGAALQAGRADGGGLAAGTAGRRPPLLPLASAARRPS
ncbi:hypothetical protein [Streptomyces albus]|uniref:hypothetical protein n=1 Tax=Streptomyces albus TaxID=1888 RepID=UPI003F1A4FC5